VGLLREIEPSLQNVPVYLLSEAEWPSNDNSLDCLAYTGPFLDVAMSDYLLERGRWLGEGFATVLFLDRINCGMENLLGVLLHELAHWSLFAPRISRFDDAYVYSDLTRRLIAEANNERKLVELSLPPWEDHGLDFVRNGVHLWHRATAICPEIKPFHLSYSGPYYDCGEHVWPALMKDELRDLRDVPIRSIREHVLPNKLLPFWECLTAWWHPIAAIK